VAAGSSGRLRRNAERGRRDRTADGSREDLSRLLIGERFRTTQTDPVAYLTGNKQLAAQVERHASDLGLPTVRFQGPKEGWNRADLRAYHFGEAVGVMNYWNYFNASPGVDPAGLLILDDVHLLEDVLRGMFTVSIQDDPLLSQILGIIVDRCPYYSLAADLLNGTEPLAPPEMLVFPDSAELAEEVRDLLDAGLEDGSSAWWSWQRIRDRLAVCSWLVSSRGLTFTPYIPPTQTLDHFSQPSHRLYMSATVGNVEDLRRRLGTPPLKRLGAVAEPRQGERFVLVRDDVEMPTEAGLLDEVRPLIETQGKSLWLCARKETASNYVFALAMSALSGQVRLLEGDNGEDEPFAEDEQGHLVAAGRYDGMDFPDDTCRIEVLPEVPVATSDLEEFVSAYLRDAPFARVRFAQRVAQALGRCNRSDTDRAVYILADPEFLSRLQKPDVLDSLPDHVREDAYAGIVRSDHGFEQGLADAQIFLKGVEVTAETPPARRRVEDPHQTAEKEIEGSLALWGEDYDTAARLFDEVARDLSPSPEYRAYWLAMRALALRCAHQDGDRRAGREMRAAMAAAVKAGGMNTFFSRLKRSESRLKGRSSRREKDSADEVFAAWDKLLDKLGPTGPRFDQWAKRLLDDLRSGEHDVVARGIARAGSEVLGLPSGAPTPTKGEEDAHWQLRSPYRTITFEVKMAPKARRVVNQDIEQAEGAARAIESKTKHPVRGVLVTPHEAADDTAVQRLDKVRLLLRDDLAAEIEAVIEVLRQYRRGWGDEAAARVESREDVADMLPNEDWLWRAGETGSPWISPDALDSAWSAD
jgi:hypothetical protein